MFKKTGMILCIGFLLQGCSGALVKQQAAAVTSSPSAASVYANGQKLGLTPLHHNLYKAFPAGWEDWEYSARGTLVVKKEGCQDFSLKINDLILSKPIHAELNCSQVVKDQAVMPTAVMEKAKPAAAPAAKPVSAIEKRLRELEALYKKGVITQQEYRETRKRILGEL